MRKVALEIAVVAVLVAPAVAGADEDDGLYGRFDGDLTFAASAGGGVVLGSDASGEEDHWALAADARIRYLDTAGLAIGAEWHPDGGERVILALDLRPVFLWHFLTGAWSGQRFSDLVIGSIGLDLGLALGPFGEETDSGVALAVGLGLDVPLWWGDGGDPGLFVHLGARHVVAAPGAIGAPQAAVADWLLLASLGVRFSADANIATVEPDRYETPD